MGIDLEMANKGVKVPYKGLLDQGRAHAELEKKHHDKLVSAGWEDTDRQAFEKALATVDSKRADTVMGRVESESSTAVEQAAITAAKAFKRRLLLGVTDLNADHKLNDEDRRAFNAGDVLGRATNKLSKYLLDVSPVVKKHDDALKKYFEGQSALAKLQEVKIALDNAQSKQEVSVTSLPAETQGVYEAMGILLSLIEKMNRIAKIAYDGDAITAAVFNKDLILRARKKKKVTEPVG